MKFFWFIFIVLSLVISSCSTASRAIGYDKDRTVDFSQFKTFAWIPNPEYVYKDKRYNSEIMENNIKSFVNVEMQAKGLTLDNKNPDIVFTYDLQVEKGETTQEIPIMSNPGPIMPMMNNGFWFNNHMHMNMWNNPWNYNGFWGNPMGGMFLPPPPQIIGYRTRQIPFKNGTLILSVSERKTNRLVWRAWGQDCILDPFGYKLELEEKLKLMTDKYPKVRK